MREWLLLWLLFILNQKIALFDKPVSFYFSICFHFNSLSHVSSQFINLFNTKQKHIPKIPSILMHKIINWSCFESLKHKPRCSWLQSEFKGTAVNARIYYHISKPNKPININTLKSQFVVALFDKDQRVKHLADQKHEALPNREHSICVSPILKPIKLSVYRCFLDRKYIF